MNLYYYRAKHGPEEYCEDFIQAENRTHAVQQILHKGGNPVVVRESAGRQSHRGSSGQEKVNGKVHGNADGKVKAKGKVSSKELVLFARQLSDLVGAGVDVLTALNLIRRQIKEGIFKQAVGQICRSVDNGVALSEALASDVCAFPGFYRHMVRAGEVSGTLDVVLALLAEHVEKEQRIRQKIWASLAYPLFILMVGIGTLAVLLIYVIPQMTLVFEDLGQEMPVITRLVVGFSRFCLRFGWGIGVFLLLAGVGLRHWFGCEQKCRQLHAWVLRVAYVRDFIRIIEFSRFTRTLAILIRAGVSVSLAFGYAVAGVRNRYLQAQLAAAATQVNSGQSLVAALSKESLLPPYALSMIAVGEQTGHLAQALARIAAVLERQQDHITSALVSLVGPGVLVIIISLVGVVIVAMLLPVFNMNILM